MAQSYHQILSGLVPANAETTAELEKLAPDQKKIFEWLYEEVPNFDPPASDLLSMIPDDEHLPPKPKKIQEEKPSASLMKLRDSSQTPNIPRIDLYQKLLDVYEAERFRWAEFKNSARPKDDDIQEKWNDYDKLLTTYAPVIDAKLEALWSVLLVRGQYHRVRKYISEVDVETVAETLQHAKEALRGSVSRSIDDTEDVHPVVFTPNDWAKYLSTNFRPEELLADADDTRNGLRVAEKERAILSLRRDALVGGRQDFKALGKAAADAGIALRTAQMAIVKGYGETAINCIQMYFDTVSRQALNKIKAVKALTDADKAELDQVLQNASEPPLSAEQWKSLVEWQTKCLQNQQNVVTANDALSNAQSAASQAHGEDPTDSLEVNKERIQSPTIDIEYYQNMLEASKNPMGIPITRIDVNRTPEKTTTL